MDIVKYTWKGFNEKGDGVLIAERVPFHKLLPTSDVNYKEIHFWKHPRAYYMMLYMQKAAEAHFIGQYDSVNVGLDGHQISPLVIINPVGYAPILGKYLWQVVTGQSVLTLHFMHKYYKQKENLRHQQYDALELMRLRDVCEVSL